MKKSSRLFLPLLLVLLVSVAVLPLQKVFADVNADEQQSANYVKQAQAQEQAAATALTNTQQCLSQNNHACATQQVNAAAAAASAAAADANAAALIAKNDSSAPGASQAVLTQIQSNAAQAQAAAASAENSAAQAATANGQVTTAQQEATAAQQSAAGTNASAQQTQTTSGVTTIPGGNNFVPLTNFPAFTNSGITTNTSPAALATFFNNLYKVCIGIAAALALLQIIRAGFTWMTAGDNATQVSHARSLIASSVFGLVLVLSPVIVFSIINPAILNLSLNFGALNQGSAAPAPGAATPATGASTPAVGSTVAQVNGACPAGSTPISGTTNCTVTTSTASSGAGSGNGSVGQNGSCQTGADCQGELVCDTRSNTCQPPGATTYTCDDDSTPNATTGLCADGTSPGTD